jgi:hypothetical protein
MSVKIIQPFYVYRLKNHIEWHKLSNEISSAEAVETLRELEKDKLPEAESTAAVSGHSDKGDSPERKRRKEEIEDFKMGDKNEVI